MRGLLVAGIFGLLGCWATVAAAQMTKPVALTDSDHDGLSDELESGLLKQFQPRWMIGRDDCSVEPAEFVPGMDMPTVVKDNGTIYGQASPRRGHKDEREAGDEIELHFYHLWRQDCGTLGHTLDAEHVAVLVRKMPEGARWRALYWYAAAHEDTVCDASQISRASTLKAEEEGATVWVSVGKHASFLNEELCRHGCGGDRCAEMKEMKSGAVVNLGEWSRLAEGAGWVRFPEWPLGTKMRRSDFTEVRLTRLEQLPVSDVAWANPAKRPAQAAIYGGNSALNGIAVGGRSTDTALVLANDDTARALGKAQRNTGDALTKSYRSVVKALGGAATKTGKALGVETKEDSPK